MIPGQSGAVEPGALVGGILVAVAGLWTLRIAVRSVGRLTSMVGTETQPVEAVEPGTVEVEGTVASAGETVSGQVSDEGAVVTEYRSQRWERDQYDHDDDSFQMPPLPQQLTPNALNKVGAVPFYVEDDTGRVLVDPVKADVTLDADAKDRQNMGTRKKREVEARLEPGDEVYVLGDAVPSEEYTPPEPGGLLDKLLAFFGEGYREVPVSEVIQDEDIVITRDGEGSEFIVSDTAEWRGWIRQVLMALLWALITLALFAVGAYFALTGAGVSVPV